MGEKKDSFRFTVQFNAGDPSHQQVAAILNEQGRRKAQFLVNAVTHYMNCPETREAAAAPRIDRKQWSNWFVRYCPICTRNPYPQWARICPAAIRPLRPLKTSPSMPRPCWEKMVSIRSWTHWLQYRSREINR